MKRQLRFVALLVILLHSGEGRTCEGPLGQRPRPILPTTEIWSLNASIESKMGLHSRERVQKILERISHLSPNFGASLYRWPESEGPLPKLNLEIRWMYSEHPLMREIRGPKEDLTFSTLVMNENPSTNERTLMYLVYLDHFFENPKFSTPRAWAELEVNIAGDLLGRITEFLRTEKMSSAELQALFSQPSTHHMLNLKTARAQYNYLSQEIRDPAFKQRSPSDQDLLKNIHRRVERALSGLEVAQASQELAALLPVEIALDFEGPLEANRFISNLAPRLREMLLRIQKHAPKNEKNLFHWPSPDRRALQNTTYALVLTTSTHPRWRSFANQIPAFGSGTTLVMEGNPENPGQRTIVQLIYLDLLLPNILPEEVRALLLEGNLAYELLGKASVYLEQGKIPENSLIRSEIRSVAADLKGYQMEKDYVEKRLRESGLGSKDRQLLENLHKSTADACLLLEVQLQQLRNRQN